MKKLMFSLCALCIVGAAGAQVSRAPLSERAQRFSQMSVSKAEMQQEMQAMPIRKASSDTVVVTQAAYGWGKHSFLAWLGRKGLGELEKVGFCNEDVIPWVYGTGGPLEWGGSGEIGYRFATGPGTFYQESYRYPNLGVPYAAATVVNRAVSSRWLQEEEYPLMPFYFKVYNSTKVSLQSVLGGITEYAPKEYVNVVYPIDPEQYTGITDTMWIEAGCVNSKESGKPFFPADTMIKGEFKNVDASQPLGNDFCVSMVFPVTWDEEGDSIPDDSRWNACLTILSEENGDDRISQEPHSVYYVVDFEKQALYNKTEDKKRLDWLVEDSLMQPNARYAIIPFDSWYWPVEAGGGHATGEPYLEIYYTEWTALQSANKADRYVQLSPVPATDYVNFKSFTDMSRIEIYSLGGQLVKAVNVSGDTYRMDLTGMNSGMYVARIFSEKGISSKKLIVR